MRRRRKYSTKRHKDNDYYKREQLLNKKIRKFQQDYYNLSNPPLPDEYLEMDALRREIKYLLRCQEYQVWQKSYTRKHAYFDQLALFKSMYMMGKEPPFSHTLNNTTTYHTISQCGQSTLGQIRFRQWCSAPEHFF